MYDSNNASSAIESESDSKTGGAEVFSEPPNVSGIRNFRRASEPAPSFSSASKSVGARSLALALGGSTRRSRLQRQQDECEPPNSDTPNLPGEASEKSTLTPAMRKKYLKDLFLNFNSHSGLSTILSLQSESSSSGERETHYSACDSAGALWALDPLEHAWTLSSVDGNYETIVDFLSEDPTLLTRKDFVSGYTVLHWLAKNGKHETLIQLLKHAEGEGLAVNVNVKGSGGHTPLHVAAMHSQYMVVKILVGAFGADADAMDYNGKRPWQYLKENAPTEMKELLGAWDDEHTYWQMNVNNNSRSSEQSLVVDVQKKTDEVDSFIRRGRRSFRSFRKLLSPLFPGGKN